MIAHQLWWEGPEVPSKHFAVVVLALAVLARPSSVALLALLLGAEAVVVWDDMPGAGSHTLLLGVVAAATAGHVGWQLARRRRLPAPAELAARMAPLLAGTLVVLYAAATLAKLNSGFVDPERSCAAALVGQVTWWNPTLIGDWAAWPAIVGTLAAEASLAVLLLVRRTRPAALVLGTGFHLVLALAGNVPFTALVLALYAGLLPDATALRLAPLVRRPGRTLPVLAALLAGWLVLAAAEGGGPILRPRDELRVATVLLGVVVLALAVRRHAPAGRLGHRLQPAFAAALLLLVLNAATPYLGLKTESSLTMFSNLQTEGGSWNHLVLPEAVQIFDAQDRLVTVVASTDPRLVRRTRGGTRMVRFELERHLRRHPDDRATYRDAAGRLRTVSAATLPGGPVLEVLDEVAKFRDVRPAALRGC